jgi:hypothetical protein
MRRESKFQGPYVRKKLAILKEKANRLSDPRHIFYAAMLSSDTYEDYYLKVGEEQVRPQTFKNGPISGHMEMRYARTSMGWIADR